MPSLNGYWIFHNHFTESQWESMAEYFTGVNMQFKVCLGYYNGEYDWSTLYSYFNMDGTAYLSYDTDIVCFEAITPSTISGYKGDWYAEGNTAFGCQGRFIDIIDDVGMGDDENFYNLWTSIATKIVAFPITNTKWLFNTEISNPIDYAANDEDITIEGLFKSNNEQYLGITFDLYHSNIWTLYYGGVSDSVYSYGDGWTNNNYKTLNIYEFPDIPYYDLVEEPSEANGIIDAIALICRNSTYQGSADPLVKTYRLGWRVRPATQSYQVTFTASNNWYGNDEDSYIRIYDGQDNTGTLLLNQNPANKSAFPMSFTITSNYCYVLVSGASIGSCTISSNDYTSSGQYHTEKTFVIDTDGAINIDVDDFDV